MPLEIAEMIVDYTDPADIFHIRLTCKAATLVSQRSFIKYLSEKKKVYPTIPSMMSWTQLMTSAPEIASEIQTITLVGQTLSLPPMGYGWAWQDATRNREGAPTEEDENIQLVVEHLHYDAAQCAQKFVTTGQYRLELTRLLSLLPRLRTINVQKKIKSGEHIPRWGVLPLVQRLSEYYRGADLSPIFYAGWEYDAHFKRIGIFQSDVDGSDISIYSGPSVGFWEDWQAALRESGSAANARVVDECCQGVKGFCCRGMRFRPFLPQVQETFFF